MPDQTQPTLAQWLDIHFDEEHDWNSTLKMITAAAIMNPELMTKGVLVDALKTIASGCEDIIELSKVNSWMAVFNKSKLEFIRCLISLLEANKLPA